MSLMNRAATLELVCLNLKRWKDLVEDDSKLRDSCGWERTICRRCARCAFVCGVLLPVNKNHEA